MRILLIEDDLIERMKFKRSLDKLNENHEVDEAENGEEALKVLESDRVPQLIILDLNMPRLNGIGFLEQLNQNAELNHIPVVVLSTSSNDKDLKACYKNGIAGYLIKPLKYEDYVHQIERLLAYWSHNELLQG